MAEVRRKRHSRGRRSLWSRLTAMASSQSNEPRSIRWTRTVSEALIIAMSCLAPWAFGATEAWAELVLYAGVLAVTALTVYADRGSDRATRMTSVPSLALAGLVMLALVQATPLPRWLTRCISPASVSRLERLVPAVPERIVSDPESVVPPPASTLSLDPEASRITAAKLAAAWLLFQAVCALGGGYSTLSRFGTAMLVNCGGLAVFSIVQAVGWNGKLYWMRPSPGGAGPFVCHNHLAAYLNLGLGFGGATLLVWARRRTPWSESRLVDTLMYWPIYTTSLIMAAVFTSLSRGGLMAMVGAGLCAAIYLRPRKWSRSLTVTIVAIACLAGVMLIISGSSESFQARALTVLEQDSYVGRVEIWWAAIQAWARQPFWGTGMGTLSYALAPYLSINGHVARAENEYIDLLSEGGVIGITLGVALLVGIARPGIRAYRLAPQSADRCLLRGALSCSAGSP